MSDDIERLKQISSELAGPELLGPLVEALPDALLIVDELGRVVLFNRQAELLFGYHRLEVLHREVEMLLPERLRSMHRQHRSGFVRDPRVRPMGIDLDLWMRHKSGNEVKVKINLAPMVTTVGIFTLAIVRSDRPSDAQQNGADSNGGR